MSGDRYVSLPLALADSAADGRYVTLALRPDGFVTTGWTSSAFGTATLTGVASFTPTGWSSSAHGTTLVYNLRQYVFPTGRASTVAFGTPVVFNWHTYALPSGIGAGAFGTPVVYNKNQYIINGGWQSSVVSNPTEVFDPLQITYVTGIAAPTFPVSHYVADYYQYIDLPSLGINSSAVGSAMVAFRVRTLTVPFIYTNAFGTPTVESFLNVPESWRSSAFGTAFVSSRVREIAHWASTPTLRVPYPTIINRNRYVRQRGWESLQFQNPTTYNLTQYVGADPFFLNSPVNDLGQPAVVNRNRTLLPSGFSRGRFGNRTDTFVDLGARALAPAGIDSLTWGEETFIAYRIRHVYPEAWDDLRMRRWTVVYNDAFLIEPTSIGVSSQFGRPDPVFSNQQTVQHYEGRDQSSFGDAFIAYRIRTVRPRNIPFPTNFFPTVRLNPQIVAPASIELFRPYGHVVLSIFQRIATPVSVNVHQTPWVGNPVVRNRNVYPRPQPVVRGEWGRAQVYNHNQYIYAEGLQAPRLGPYVVAYRTRSVFAAQIGAPSISLIHRVRKSIADPPGAQIVYAQAIYIGFPNNVGVVPTPVARHPTIYPEVWQSSEFGTHVVRDNNIRPKSIQDIDKIGRLLISGAQWVYTEWLTEAVVGRPQMSPYTIYAPLGEEATDQARANHPADPELIDGVRNKPWFGHPMVSTSPRFLVPSNANTASDYLPFPKYGTHSVELRRRFIYPSPIRAGRLGVIRILGIPQYVGFNEDVPGFVSADVVSMPIVSRPPPNPWPVDLEGDVLGAFGEARVDLFDREVAPTGIPHRNNPQISPGDNPWGTAMVGYPRQYTLTAGETTVWGTHIIEYLHRQVWPEGWESLTLANDSLNEFRFRMRVTRRNPVNTTSGIGPSTGVGAPTISFRVRDMIVNAIWPGYVGMSRIGMSITPAGWDSLEVGDIDEWEAGTVKPHGDEMFASGTPRTGRGVQPPSIDDGALGSARTAWLVHMAGMPPVGFDGPAITDEYGCSRRVVVAWPIQIPTFSAPVVTT